MADQVTESLAQAKILVMEGQKGEKGDSYELTEQDKQEIADLVLGGDAIPDAVEEYLEENPVSVDVDATLSDTSENPVQNKVINAALQTKGTYSKPSGGIPKTDLASAVKTSLGKADSAYQKPSGGIPAADLASGVIPVVPQMATQADMSDWVSGKTLDAGTAATVFAAADAAVSGKLNIAQGAANAGKFMVVGSNGNITAVAMSAWQGGSY